MHYYFAFFSLLALHRTALSFTHIPSHTPHTYQHRTIKIVKSTAMVLDLVYCIIVPPPTLTPPPACPRTATECCRMDSP